MKSFHIKEITIHFSNRFYSEEAYSDGGMSCRRGGDVTLLYRRRYTLFHFVVSTSVYDVISTPGMRFSVLTDHIT